jgi:hypothetical protein
MTRAIVAFTNYLSTTYSLLMMTMLANTWGMVHSSPRVNGC